MSPKRLLVIIDEMEVGGSQRQIVHLLTGLDRERWQPELLYFRNHSFLIERLKDAGIPVHLVPKRGRLDWRFLRDFAGVLRRGDYDLIHAFSLTAELWAVVAKMIAGTDAPLIASERNQQVKKPKWYWPIKRFVLTRSAGVIANSEAGAHTTAKYTGLERAFFDTIPNGVQIPPEAVPAERERVRAELGVPDGRMLCLFVGRLVPQKNLDCLVAALAQLEPARRPWVALAGDGPLREHVANLARSLGVAGDVHFLGERSDATRLMQAADFLVLPSHFEGLSNSLLESMAAGCPVIASAVGGTPELIEHGKTGMLFPSDDAPALAARIAELSASAERRAQLSQAARDYVSRTYGIPALVAATTAVYERCMQRNGARPDRSPARLVSQTAEDSRS
ncbi:glycosyltransferase [Lysobacter korlensis]|uniref:Glycosyltransferase n=1 Tax=Lysobacter korlensis TaxID=553636 RepID=A0ABV6RQR0_9GAMM